MLGLPGDVDLSESSSSFEGAIGRRELRGEHTVVSAVASKLGGRSSTGTSWMAIFMISSAFAISSESKDRTSDDTRGTSSTGGRSTEQEPGRAGVA